MSNPFQAMARFAKQADPALDAANFSLAMQSAGNMGLAGFGVGAGARGMVGLWNMLKRNVNPPKLKYPGAVLTTVPIPVDDEEEKRTKISSPLGFQNQWYYEPSRVAAGARSGDTTAPPAPCTTRTAGAQARRALHDRFAYSQRFSRIDPWAERVAGRHGEEFNPLSRRLEFTPA